MKKLLLAIFAIVTLAVPAFAADDGGRSTFYTKQIDADWEVNGYTFKDKSNPGCVVQRSYRDGSMFLIIHDLADGEVMLRFKNLSWQIQPNFITQVRINLFAKDDIINGGAQPGKFVSKNGLIVRHIPSGFLASFIESDTIKVVFDEDYISNLLINVSDGGKIMGSLEECKLKFKSKQGRPT